MDTAEAQDKIVCFGMILGISSRCEQKGIPQQNLPTRFPFKLESSTHFIAESKSEIVGHIMSDHGQVVQGLLDETSLDLHTSCAVDSSQTLGHQKEPRALATSAQLLSEVIAQSSSDLQLETITQQPDLLDDLNSHEDLEEASQPSAIKRELRRHQKQALTFMLRRELGWEFDGGLNLWEIMDTDQGRLFLNRVSNASQSEVPPQCYGGIVADPMGLGKTLTMIALVATDLENSGDIMDIDEGCHLDVPATLIVVPPPLMGTWEEQLTEHVVEGRLTYLRHHREDRLRSLDELKTFNIVLTTYHTISAEWSHSNSSKASFMYSVRWKRIILDEAHLIRNGNSRMSQAICALDSRSRWAVTGTPLQNRLGDLATLFKFIRAHPYTDRRCFDADISHLWKVGQYQEAIKRLKRLHDLQCPVDFNSEERALYNKLREKAIVSVDEAMSKDANSSKAGSYVNVLQQIDSLRLVCNLGLHYDARHGKSQQNSQAESWASVAQNTFNMQREMGPVDCLQCSSTLDITETELDDPTVTPQRPLFFKCLSFICSDCAQSLKKTAKCNHDPPCTMAAVSTSGQALESTLSDMPPQPERGFPSKIEALLADIKTLPPGEKCIVFSTWRLTLDLVEAGLNQSSIPSVRFDGKVPQKDRQDIVERFRHDPSVRVMLLTLTCGAAGLTLTVATRAYIMEPHWNPTLEEQALARIHCIGQSREVTTVRFYVRDTFEQQVIKIQESKKYLAGLLLSPHDNGSASENLGRLQELISLI
ncbi:alpha-1,6-mannosyltransferase subunit [Fusarium flagelliforme]|uniref:Alpha-1,6-mannosyltransferase subunit n=1 Tax=Fusarium flagelliforme TaxID=2675880 RepID=A0A395MU22_9HYPO|nr:alpha-1,6-mannosyltransferase subunit [Fusarium flagelliforme]